MRITRQKIEQILLNMLSKMCADKNGQNIFGWQKVVAVGKPALHNGDFANYVRFAIYAIPPPTYFARMRHCNKPNNPYQNTHNLRPYIWNQEHFW